VHNTISYVALHVTVPKAFSSKQVLGIVSPLHSAGHDFLPADADSQDPVASLEYNITFF